MGTVRENMLRKPILMPPSMIKRIDKIAKHKKVSFANVVREAVSSFNEQDTDEVIMLEILADTMLATTQDIVKKIEQIEQKLDDTHSLIEEAQ